MSVSNCPLHTHMKGSTSPNTTHSFLNLFPIWPSSPNGLRDILIVRWVYFSDASVMGNPSLGAHEYCLISYSLILWTIGQTVMIIGKEHFLNPLRIFETTISFRGKPGCQESHKCCQFSMLLPVVEVYNLLLYGNTSTRKWRTGKVLNGSITTLLQLLTSVSRPLSLLYPCTKDVP